MWELDVRRYGSYASATKYLVERSCETYEKDYAVSYPNEERPAGRPMKTSPIYDRLKAQGAVFAARGGWEQPMWFAPKGVEPVEELTFRRPNWLKYVGEECRAVRGRVGVLDQTGLGKLEVSGQGATDFLERLSANRVGQDVGRIVMTQMLNERGGIECDVVIACLAPDRYFVITAATLLTHDSAWMERHLPADGSVRLQDVTGHYACLSLSGPRAPLVLRRVSDDNLSDDTLPPMTFAGIAIGYAPVRAMRLSWIGEPGWELCLPVEYQRYVYDRLMEAGREFGIVNYGYRAVDSMRLEKGFRVWGADLSAKTTPFEAGLAGWVEFDKGDFFGRSALLRQRQEGVERTLASLIVETKEAMPHGWDPVWRGDRIVGYVTSGNYGHTVDKTIAMAYLPVPIAEPDTSLEIQIVGERYRATVAREPIYDPDDAKLSGIGGGASERPLSVREG